MSGNNHKDWIPYKHSDIYILALAVIGYLTSEVLERLGIVAPDNNSPAADGKHAAYSWFVNVFKHKYETYSALYNLYIDPSTQTRVVAQQFYTAEAQFVEALRQFYMGFVRNNLNATDADRVAMGFPILKKTRAKALPPREIPEVEIKHPSTGVVELIIRRIGGQGRPNRSIRGCEICSIVSDSPVRDGEWYRLTRSDFSVMSTFRFTSYSNCIGQTLYFAVRWENTLGEKGPWTRIYRVVIS
ncbi:MAG: hypothetical protein LBC81_02385 [Tannerellaceae bacterium]|jgi:hypothetical protein|nr:hypothetical protein [Tannerellaceae bacterium]